MSDNDDDVKVVLEQTLLRTEEVFVYKIPPMMTSGGHHADDWDLANPIATCSLHVLRRDSTLFIKLLTDKPKPNGPPGATEKHLFANSKITLDLSSSNNKLTSMGHWIEPVTDSSRYFVIRISDEKRNKEAHVGVGFRERNDALNFKMSLQEYENAMRKEAMVYDEDYHHGNLYDDTTIDGDGGVESDTKDLRTIEAVSKLSLKEGEKIHINLKGTTRKSSSSINSSSQNRTKKSSSSSSSSSGDKLPLLLRKPPTVVINTEGIKLSNSQDVGLSQQNSFQCVSSVAAVAETTTDVDDDDEEEWGDFECSTFESK